MDSGEINDISDSWGIDKTVNVLYVDGMMGENVGRQVEHLAKSLATHRAKQVA
jgi:hypothetical protein